MNDVKSLGLGCELDFTADEDDGFDGVHMFASVGESDDEIEIDQLIPITGETFSDKNVPANPVNMDEIFLPESEIDVASVDPWTDSADPWSSDRRCPTLISTATPTVWRAEVCSKSPTVTSASVSPSSAISIFRSLSLSSAPSPMSRSSSSFSPTDPQIVSSDSPHASSLFSPTAPPIMPPTPPNQSSLFSPTTPPFTPSTSTFSHTSLQILPSIPISWEHESCLTLCR